MYNGVHICERTTLDLLSFEEMVESLSHRVPGSGESMPFKRWALELNDTVTRRVTLLQGGIEVYGWSEPGWHLA